MSLFAIFCIIIIAYTIWCAIYYEEWSAGFGFGFSILSIAAALIIALVVSGIAFEITGTTAYYEVNRYPISECVETIENYDVVYYNPDMGYKSVSWCKENCYLNPLLEGEKPYVIVKMKDFNTKLKRNLFWLLDEEYIYCLYLPEGGN